MWVEYLITSILVVVAPGTSVIQTIAVVLAPGAVLTQAGVTTESTDLEMLEGWVSIEFNRSRSVKRLWQLTTVKSGART
ncbi:hypothetical protein IWQ49_006553 [Labrenzia sp. EL_126]|nr:hypothetical protein [Labrenzia sp. EL_126]